MMHMDEHKNLKGENAKTLRLNPTITGHKNEGKVPGGGGEGKTPVTTACPEEKVAEDTKPLTS